MLTAIDGCWTLKLKGGERLVVPATLQNASTFMFLEQEDWFEPEVAFLRRLVRPGFRAVDIGANLGFYTILLATGCGPSGRVWAFEPDSSPSALLRRSLALNGLANTEILEFAVGEHEGEGALERGVSSEGNMVRYGVAPRDAADRVKITRLDDVAQRAGIRDIDFIKIDAEGSEVPILRGGRTLLAAESPLIMAEICHNGRFQPDLLREFSSLGYQSWRYAPALGCLVPLSGDRTDLSSYNIFACKSDRAKELAKSGFLATDSRDVPDTREAFVNFVRAAQFGVRLQAEIGSIDARQRCRRRALTLRLWIATPHRAMRDARCRSVLLFCCKVSPISLPPTTRDPGMPARSVAPAPRAISVCSRTPLRRSSRSRRPWRRAGCCRWTSHSCRCPRRLRRFRKARARASGQSRW
jgi:FkbM family methyltransferase